MSTCCGQGDVLLLACSGGCNVGQIANDAAKALDQLGQGTFYCVIGVGLQLPAFIERSKKPGTTVAAIDGCAVACVQKALANIGVTPAASVIATELGIEKGHHFNHTKEEVGKVAQAVTDKLNAGKCCNC